MDMSSNFVDRFAELVKNVGGDDAAARITGVSVKTIARWRGGSEPSFNGITLLARHQGISLEWLVTGKGAKFKGARGLEDRDRKAMANGTFWDKSPEEQEMLDEANMQGFVALPVLAVTASAGGGAVAPTEEQSGWVMFDRAWLYSAWHLNPTDLFSIGSAGESMEPTIKAGEYLLASRAEDHLKPGDGIYAVRLDGQILVKRLQLMPGGKLIVTSDNPAYKPFEIYLDDGVDFTILGKVVLVYGMRRI